MGSRTYEFLADSFLFDKTLIGEKFASVSEQELETELRRYYEFAMKEAPTVEGEISQNPSSLVIVSDEPLNTAHLIHSSLYVNQYVFDDPLLPLVERLDRTADAMNQSLTPPCPALLAQRYDEKNSDHHRESTHSRHSSES